MTTWLFSRDVNVTLDNVLPFLQDPTIVAGARNPAARPSAFQDWGLWNMETNSPTEIGQALLEERINWQECLLIILSKRSSHTEMNNAVKPLVVICKAIRYMMLQNTRRLSKSSCAQYLIPINNYNEIENAVNNLLTNDNPTATNNYLDIWFNALVESRLFIYPYPRNKDVIELAHTPYAEGICRFISLYGDRMAGTPSKDNNRIEYYRYLGSMQTGLVELLSPMQSILEAFPHFINVDGNRRMRVTTSNSTSDLLPYLTAIRTKPFLLLAGISGTGKSRLARQLAQATASNELANAQKPGNFELIPVKPNWHDSTELLGYVSRISGEPVYVMTDFVRFLFKAMLYPRTPFFLCLDEMNLAPVEQYFAEYLSVIETRSKMDDETIATDVLVKFDLFIYDSSVLEQLRACCSNPEAPEVLAIFNKIRDDGGIRIPSNLVVIGTVNMDETTFSFSRKDLDRAMSFELNEVNMDEGVMADNSALPSIDAAAVKANLLTANEAYQACQPVSNIVLERLKRINGQLDGTPFKIAYRSRNEIMIYVYERMRDSIAMNYPDENSVRSSSLFHQAMDEAISMKILSRIEGDEQRIQDSFLVNLETAITGDVTLEQPDSDDVANQGDNEPDVTHRNNEPYPICRAKLKQMRAQLKHGYVSFWS